MGVARPLSLRLRPLDWTAEERRALDGPTRWWGERYSPLPTLSEDSPTTEVAQWGVTFPRPAPAGMDGPMAWDYLPPAMQEQKRLHLCHLDRVTVTNRHLSRAYEVRCSKCDTLAVVTHASLVAAPRDSLARAVREGRTEQAGDRLYIRPPRDTVSWTRSLPQDYFVGGPSFDDMVREDEARRAQRQAAQADPSPIAADTDEVPF